MTSFGLKRFSAFYIKARTKASGLRAKMEDLRRTQDTCNIAYGKHQAANQFDILIIHYFR